MDLANKSLDVTGVEFAPSAVAKAEKLALENDVTPQFIQSDLFDWNWPTGAFDMTLGFFSNSPARLSAMCSGARCAM